jgi:hypothetical protein
VAIACIALLLRLPTRPLQYVAIALLLSVNLVQAGARIYYPTEAPVDQIARDMFDGSKDSTALVFIGPLPSERGGPGFGRIDDGVGEMYEEMLGMQVDRLHPKSKRKRFNSLERIPQTVKDRSDTNRVIVWNADDSPTDTLAAQLGPDWKCTDTEIHPIYVHWSWGKLYTLTRREYVKSSPSTQPNTAR